MFGVRQGATGHSIRRLSGGRLARGRVRRGLAGCAAVALLALGASAADAQPRRPGAPREPRVLVTVGGGAQAAGSDTSDRLEWEEHFETAVADVNYGSGTTRWLAGGVGVRLWRQFGVGIAVSSASRDAAAGIEARIPHPFHFEQPREISGQTDALSRSETGVHVQVLYLVPTAGRLRIVLSAGPSRIEARQDTVTEVRYTDEFPFDTAAFQRADTRALSATAVGFNAGADAAFMFTRAVGVAGIVRFTRASMELARPDGGRLSIEAGGVQVGAGLRLAF